MVRSDRWQRAVGSGQPMGGSERQKTEKEIGEEEERRR